MGYKDPDNQPGPWSRYLMREVQRGRDGGYKCNRCGQVFQLPLDLSNHNCPAKDTAESNEEKAGSHSKNGRVDECHNLYDYAKAQGMHVEDTQTWLELHREFYKKGEYHAASECLDEAIKLGQRLEELYALKALVYHRQGRYHEAIHYSDKVTDIEPDEIHSWFLKGDAYYRLGKFGQAVKCLDKALFLNPADYDALKLRDSAHTLSHIYPDEAPRYTWKKMEKDVQEIVNAITRGAEHPAVSYRKGKIVLNPRKIPHLMDAHSQTVGERSKRLKDRVRQVMAVQTGYVETYYRSMLAYKTNARGEH